MIACRLAAVRPLLAFEHSPAAVRAQETIGNCPYISRHRPYSPPLTIFASLSKIKKTSDSGESGARLPARIRHMPPSALRCRYSLGVMPSVRLNTRENVIELP